MEKLGGGFGDSVNDLIWGFSNELVWNFSQDFNRDSSQDFSRILTRYFGRQLVRDIGRYFGQNLGLPKLTLAAPWLPIFAVVEASSVAGRASPRAALAYGNVPVGEPLLTLFRVACQASFESGDTGRHQAAAAACDVFNGDPLWPALARHIARISTGDDRALLMELARHPERREPPLSWGLQHYVRGDLVLDDDSVVTLDELCAQKPGSSRCRSSRTCPTNSTFGRTTRHRDGRQHPR